MSEEELSSLQKSIEFWSGKSKDNYKDWLQKTIQLNNSSSIFLFKHIENFLELYSGKIGNEEFFFKEKLFFLSIELKRYTLTKKLFSEFYKKFGNDKKIIRMYASKNEIDPKVKVGISLDQYKQLIIDDEDDRESLKRYILFMKLRIKFSNINEYIDLWNEYLKVYMDDSEAWNELSDVYLSVNNYNKAIYCLEELLLHNPNNYKTLNKIGDIYASLNNAENAKIGLKYYSQSILIQPTPRAFWGIYHCINTIFREEKKIGEKEETLLKIVKEQLNNFYQNSPFKIDFDKYFPIGLKK